HRVPDGRGRNPTADDPGDFATYRGTAAAATVGTGMRRPIFMHQRQPTGGVRPNATQNGQTDPRTPCRSLLCRKSPLSRVGTSRQSRKSLQFAPLRVHPGNPGLSLEHTASLLEENTDIHRQPARVIGQPPDPNLGPTPSDPNVRATATGSPAA